MQGFWHIVTAVYVLTIHPTDNNQLKQSHKHQWKATGEGIEQIKHVHTPLGIQREENMSAWLTKNKSNLKSCEMLWNVVHKYKNS